MVRKAGTTKVERAVLEDLAAGSRILAAHGIVDSAGHISMRHPRDPQLFLMSRALAPALVTADDIMAFDLGSAPLDPRGRATFIERFIHGEAYRRRPDVMAVVHSHTPSVIPFSLTRTPLRAMYHNAAFLAAGVPVFDIRKKFGVTDSVISDAAKGRALAEVLGDKPVALLRAHGMVVVAPSVPLAVFRAFFTDVSARIQMQAISLGGPIAALSRAEGALADEVNIRTVGRAWDLWKRKLPRV